jgi:FAD/FMN-containing dehydrogenase
MTTSTFSPAHAAVRLLRSSMRGTVLIDGDASYDQARQIWNGAVDRRPAVIAQCAGDDDVTRAVAAAREHDLALSVRGGGHDWAGRALNDAGLVLDLSAMRGVTVDPDAGVAVAQGGATAGDVVAAAGRYGLTPVTGTVKAVGMAGLTLAGGYGPLTGKHGLALDNLLGATVVLADGRTVIASDTEDSDLTCTGRCAAAAAASSSRPPCITACIGSSPFSPGCCCSPSSRPRQSCTATAN